MNHFRIGGKVVCIYDGPWMCMGCMSVGCAKSAPALGQTYTVDDIMHNGPVLGLVLAECRENAHGLDKPSNFDARCFKPVIERKTDISALLALQNPKNHKPLPDVTPVKAPARV